jgi:predicted TIM-barrel fold metal-dependent hydrolase
METSCPLTVALNFPASPPPTQFGSLTSLVPTTQILFGSDNPFIPLAETAEGMMQLGFSEDDLRLIGRDNALALLPRLKSG